MSSTASAANGLTFYFFRKDIQNEYRKNFKSAFHSEREKYGFEQNTSNKIDNKVIANGHSYDPAWYKEVLELRKKAGEYRVSQLPSRVSGERNN